MCRERSNGSATIFIYPGGSFQGCEDILEALSAVSSLSKLKLASSFPALQCYSDGVRDNDAAGCQTAAVVLNALLKPICLCSNGSPAACTFDDPDGSEKCSSCHSGFHLIDTRTNRRCVPNECSCLFGTEAKGQDCAVHGSAACATCDPGYHLTTSRLCLPNECSCSNGEAAQVYTPCKVHSTEQCTGCDAGYDFKSDTMVCEQTFTCTCEDGIAATGSECKADGVTCASCSDGYHLDGALECRKNVCLCQNGTAAVGPACTVDGDFMCTACNPGFGGAECAPTTCICPNGIAAMPIHCSVAGAVACKSCKPGFSGAKCSPNQCTCPSGTAATGLACHEPNANVCTRCDTGRHLDDNGECALNVCICSEGTPLLGPGCPADGAVGCAPTTATTTTSVTTTVITTATAKSAPASANYRLSTGAAAGIGIGIVITGFAIAALRARYRKNGSFWSSSRRTASEPRPSIHNDWTSVISGAEPPGYKRSPADGHRTLRGGYPSTPGSVSRYDVPESQSPVEDFRSYPQPQLPPGSYPDSLPSGGLAPPRAQQVNNSQFNMHYPSSLHDTESGASSESFYHVGYMGSNFGQEPTTVV